MMTRAPNNSRFVFSVATIEQFVDYKVLISSTFQKRGATCLRDEECECKIFICKNSIAMPGKEMVLYPSKEWLGEYCRKLNQSKEYKEAGKGWGVGWNGNFILQIENIPIDKISVEDLPADLAKELKEHLVNGISYSYIQLQDGECKGARPLKDPDEVEAGFVMKGPYENWKKLTKGEIDATRALLTRQLKLEGNMAKVMQYTRAATIMTNISSSIKTDFIDEVYRKK